MLENKDPQKQDDLALSDDGAAFAATLATSFTDDDGFLVDTTLINIDAATGQISTADQLPPRGQLRQNFRTVAVVNVTGPADLLQTLGEVLGGSLELSQQAYEDTGRLLSDFNTKAQAEPLHVRMINQMTRDIKAQPTLQKVQDVLKNHLKEIKEKKKTRPESYKKSRKARDFIRDLHRLLKKKDPAIKTGDDLAREYAERLKDQKFLEQNPLAQSTDDVREMRKAYEKAHAQDYSASSHRLKPNFYNV